MRNESELFGDFKRGEENTPAYWRERVILEVLIDIRNVLSDLVKKFT